MTSIIRAFIVTGFCAAAATAAQAEVLWQTNFDSASPFTYTTDGTVNSGGATTDDVTVSPFPESPISVVDLGGGNHALQVVDNRTDSNARPRVVSPTFTGISTTSTGTNQIAGSFTYTRLISDTSSATSPSFVFIISSNGALNTGSTTSAVQLLVEGGKVKYLNGGTVTDSGVTLTTGQEYRFDIALDLSSDTQDTWALAVTDLSDNSVVVDVTSINTRAANVTPNIMSFPLGNNTAGANPDPFVQIDNINFSSGSNVPEPASLSLFSLALACVYRRCARK